MRDRRRDQQDADAAAQVADAIHEREAGGPRPGREALGRTGIVFAHTDTSQAKGMEFLGASWSARGTRRTDE